MRKLVTEAIGTFFLVLTIGFTAVAPTPLAPIAIGSILMVMVYMGGHISGAHYNPAVTVAILLRGAIPRRDVLPYIAAQIIGAILAATTVLIVTGQSFAPQPADGVAFGHALLCEVLFTFALALVILNVATAPDTQGNSYFGLAIGFTVGAGAFAVGGISGGAFNPAVGIGPIIVHSFAAETPMIDLWLYLLGPLLGGVLAAAVFRGIGGMETAIERR